MEFFYFPSQNPHYTFQYCLTLAFCCDIVVLILFRKVVPEQYNISCLFRPKTGKSDGGRYGLITAQLQTPSSAFTVRPGLTRLMNDEKNFY